MFECGARKAMKLHDYVWCGGRYDCKLAFMVMLLTFPLLTYHYLVS